MKMTNEEYKNYADRHMPRSRILRNMLRAFVSGGMICAFGQVLLTVFATAGLDFETSCTACSVTLIFLGAVLTGVGVYDELAKFAGAGTLVPITGFSNSVVSPALEFKSEGYITGSAAKMFVIAGPVIVFGVSASVIYGIVLWITGG